MTMSDSFVDFLRYNDRSQYTEEQVRNVIYHELCHRVAHEGGQSCFDLFLGMTEMLAEKMIGLSAFEAMLDSMVAEGLFVRYRVKGTVGMTSRWRYWLKGVELEVVP